jgi:hypothetical protein
MVTTAEIAAEIRSDYEARYSAPRHELVEAGRVRDYLLAMNEPADLESGMPVPSLFLLTLGRTRRPQPSRGSAVNAGDEFEFLAPVFVGDTVTITRQVLSIDEKLGKVGVMFLTTAEYRFMNQKGQLVGKAINKTLRWGL